MFFHIMFNVYFEKQQQFAAVGIHLVSVKFTLTISKAQLWKNVAFGYVSRTIRKLRKNKKLFNTLAFSYSMAPYILTMWKNQMKYFKKTHCSNTKISSKQEYKKKKKAIMNTGV